MQEKSDGQLLREYVERKNEAAFREIVVRHMDLVYSAALRRLNCPELAKDVAQRVFVDLARKARPLIDQFKAESSLVGWLFRSTRFASLNQLREDRRRATHERQAVEQLPSNTEAESPWERVRPMLDEAMDELSDRDRDAVLLRYFKKLEFRSVGLALGVSDDTAQKRVSRAVERLRDFFAKRGVTISAGGVVAVMSANAVQAAPVGLAITISAAALTGTTLATTATAVATKALAMTVLQKTLITATILVAVGASVFEAHRVSTLQSQVLAVQQKQAPLAQQIEQLTREREETEGELAMLRAENGRLNENAGELLRLRGEVSMLRRAQSTNPKPAESSPAPQPSAPSPQQAAMDLGRELGLQIVRGEAGALNKLTEVTKAAQKDFRTRSPGLADTQRGDLAFQTFASGRTAFEVIGEAALTGNQVAIDAVERALLIPELKGYAVDVVGKLADEGNESALEILLNPDKYGILLSSTVFALRSAAEKGNQQAIEALSAVTRDTQKQALWFGAASGLAAAAESGNSVAVDALVGLAGSTNLNVRNAVLNGLQRAAANQNAKAIETLRTMGSQSPAEATK